MLTKTVQELLKQKPLYCAVVNKFSEPEATNYLISQGCKRINSLPLSCFVNEPLNKPLPPSPQTHKDKLLYYYTLDIASLLPVLALSPQPSSNVLDMCAAPGGKAFALTQLLSLQSSKSGGSLVLNDSSQSRLTRLKDVIFSRCLPRDLKHSVRVTKRKGEDWSRIGEREYQCALVDAPCSSDRHHITQWERKAKMYPHSEELSRLQVKLLLAAMSAVQPGGVVVYSTCTLSDCENNGVIHQALKVADSKGLSIRPSIELTELLPLYPYLNYHCSEYGVLVVPSESSNCGPMFVSKLCVCVK